MTTHRPDSALFSWKCGCTGTVGAQKRTKKKKKPLGHNKKDNEGTDKVGKRKSGRGNTYGTVSRENELAKKKRGVEKTMESTGSGF